MTITTRARFIPHISISALVCLQTLSAAESLQAVAADEFVDSLGVNIHVHYQDTIYNDFGKLKLALQQLGVRHTRDGFVDTKWDGFFERHNELGRTGIHCTFITGIDLSRVLPLAGLLTESLEAFEGPNEVNLNGWEAERAATYQKELWKTIRADAAWNDKPIVSLSVTNYEYGEKLGDLSNFADFGNIHPYPGGWEPENKNSWMIADLPSGIAGGRKFTGEKPIMVTEIGYTNHLAKSGHVAVTPEMSGVYMPRMLINSFQHGIKRTYIYELFDLHDNPKDQESNFGLIKADGVTFKPAGIAMKNLIQILKDPGKDFPPASLSFTISEEKARSALFQKRNGDFYLAVWLPSSLWDGARPYGQKQPQDPADKACVITLAQPARSVTAITGFDTALHEAPLATDKPIELSISERVTILRISYQ